MMRKTVPVVLSAVLVLSLVVSGGCASTTGSGSEASDTLPEGFPADVPVYDGTIVDSEKTDADGGTGYTVDLTAPDAVDDVVSWYEDELAGGGWITATASMPNSAGNVITGDKDGQSVIVTVLEGDGGTTLSVEYSPAD